MNNVIEKQLSSPAVRWDDSGMATCYPQVWELVFNRSEIAMLFGAPQDRQQGVRILMHPLLARNLHQTLGRMLQNLELVLGPLSPAKAGTGTEDRLADSVGWEDVNGDAAVLLQFVRNLKVEYSFERSVKFSQNELRTNRFLVAFRKESLGNAPAQKMHQVCSGLKMPENCSALFFDHLAEASIILLGFEEDEGKTLFKAYLEFGDRWHEALRKNATEPFLLYSGFKWDPAQCSRQVMGTYTGHACLSFDEIMNRVSGFYHDGAASSGEIVKEILRFASGRAGDKPLYLEAREEGSPRRSFDINFYKANIRMHELFPLLHAVGGHYAIPAGEVAGLNDRIGDLIFGHLSAGQDRKGKEYLTFYFAEKTNLSL